MGSVHHATSFGASGSDTSKRLTFVPVVGAGGGAVLADAEHPVTTDRVEVAGEPGQLELTGHLGGRPDRTGRPRRTGRSGGRSRGRPRSPSKRTEVICSARPMSPTLPRRTSWPSRSWSTVMLLADRPSHAHCGPSVVATRRKSSCSDRANWPITVPSTRPDARRSRPSGRPARTGGRRWWSAADRRSTSSSASSGGSTHDGAATYRFCAEAYTTWLEPCTLTVSGSSPSPHVRTLTMPAPAKRFRQVHPVARGGPRVVPVVADRGQPVVDGGLVDDGPVVLTGRLLAVLGLRCEEVEPVGLRGDDDAGDAVDHPGALVGAVDPEGIGDGEVVGIGEVDHGHPGRAPHRFRDREVVDHAVASPRRATASSYRQPLCTTSTRSPSRNISAWSRSFAFEVHGAAPAHRPVDVDVDES